MNKLVRTSAVVAASALAVPLWAVPSAHAATTSEPASIGAYFYSAGIDKPEQSPAAPPNVTGDATDGVAAGNLAVAVRVPSQTDKMSFLFFDLAGVPFDASISKASLTVPLAEATSPTTDPRQANVQRSPAPEKVRVCAAGPEGFNGEDGASFAAAPAVDCKAFSAPAKESADKKGYVFDVTGLAATWLTAANNGVALVPSEAAMTSEFQVVFQAFDKATLATEFTPAAPLDLGTPSLPSAPTFDTFTTTTGGGTSFDSGSFDAPVSEAPVVDTVLPEPAVMEAPAPEPEVAAVTPVRNVALADVPLTPTAAFWIGLAAVAALLGFLGLVMGDPRVPAASAGGQSRLSRALQQRQQGAARGPRLASARPLSI